MASPGKQPGGGGQRVGPVAKAVQLWGLASEVALAAGVALAPLGALGLVPLGLVGRLVGGGLVQAVPPAAVLLKKQKSKSAGGMEFYQLPEPARSFTWFAAHLGEYMRPRREGWRTD